MKKIFSYIVALIVALVGFSCTDNAEVGSSLSDTKVSVVVDSTFTITGQTAEIPRVKSRTIMQLLGTIQADNFGVLSSDVVTEMMPTAEIDTAGVDEYSIDEVRMVMFVRAKTGFTGDSIVPMKLDVYELTKQLPSPIYSDFNPESYYDPNKKLGSATYTASDMDKSTEERSAHFYSYYDEAMYGYSYYEVREARVQLPLEYGKMLFREYKSNPRLFRDPEAFAAKFPGFYIKNSFGSGRVMNFSNTEIEVLYHRKYKTEFGTDTIVNDSASYLAATPEILSNNIIRMDIDEKLKSQVEEGAAVLLAPQGYQVDIKVPILDIIAKYNLGKEKMKVINVMSLEIPVEVINNDYGLTPPNYVLLIRTSEKDDFFNENKLTDGRRSYVGEYNPATKKYVFSGLRAYLNDIINSGKEPTADDENISIIPIDITNETVTTGYSYYYGSETSDMLTKVAPMVSRPSMVKLKIDKAKVVLGYTNHSALD